MSDPLDPQLIARISDALTRGQIPGYGSAQNETYTPSDNVDSTHGLNIRYIIPSNAQRVIAARLSFHLDKYRTYDHTASAGLHVHYWVAPGTSSALTYTLGMDASGNPRISGSTPPPYGWQTSTEMWSQISGATAPSFSTLSLQDTTGHTHAQVLGVTEGATANNVSISFDGTDKTSALGGPWTADVVEMDVLPYLNTTKGAYHLITLTPTTLGRIEAHLRFNFYVNASINA